MMKHTALWIVILLYCLPMVASHPTDQNSRNSIWTTIYSWAAHECHEFCQDLQAIRDLLSNERTATTKEVKMPDEDTSSQQPHQTQPDLQTLTQRLTSLITDQHLANLRKSTAARKIQRESDECKLEAKPSEVVNASGQQNPFRSTTKYWPAIKNKGDKDFDMCSSDSDQSST